MIYSPADEAPTERLIMVTLDGVDGYTREVRHIRATIVRRAMSHQVIPATDTRAEQTVYWDDKVATGYRNASYSSSKKNGLYVDGMFLRGQMDLGPKPLNEGMPYATDISFNCQYLKAREAHAISNFFTKYDKAVEHYRQNGIVFKRTDNFENALREMAVVLDIGKFVFIADTDMQYSSSLSDAHRFVEESVAGFGWRVIKLINKVRGINQATNATA